MPHTDSNTLSTAEGYFSTKTSTAEGYLRTKTSTAEGYTSTAEGYLRTKTRHKANLPKPKGQSWGWEKGGEGWSEIQTNNLSIFSSMS